MKLFENAKDKLTTWKKSKKIMLAALAGTIAFAGLAASQLPQSTVEAAWQGNYHGGFHRGYDNQGGWQDDRNYSVEDMAKNIADTYGVDQKLLMDYNKKGWKMYDLDEAGFLSVASGKSFKDVLNMKTASNNWRNVGESLGLTREQFIEARHQIMEKRLSVNLNMDASTVKNLLQQGYHPRDIAIANALATKSGKTFNDVLAMKQINNRWSDIADNIGISENDYRDALYNSRPCFGPGYGGFNGFHDGYGNGRGGHHW